MASAASPLLAGSPLTAVAPQQQWRPFKFISSETLKNTGLDALEITTACSGRSHIVAGDASGTIRCFDRGCKAVQQEWEAYSGPVTHMKLLKTRNVLITVGDDDSLNVSVVRLWDLDKINATSKKPIMREHRFFNAKYTPPASKDFPPLTLRVNYNDDVISKLKFFGNRAKKDAADGSGGAAAAADGSGTGPIAAADFKTAVVAFDVTEDLQHMCIGLCNGEIIFVRGDLERDRSPKVKRVKGGLSKAPLTFVGFPRPKLQDTGRSAQLPTNHFVALCYVVYEDMTTVWRITSKAEYLENGFDPQIGAKADCAAMNDAEVIVGSSTSSSVAFFGGDQFYADMAASWDPAFLSARQWCEVEGDKRKVTTHKHYLVVLARPDSERKPDRFILQFYDVDARIKGLNPTQGTFTNVSQVLSGTSEVVVVSQEGKAEQVSQKICKLVEVDTQAKLDQLFKKDLYDEAKRMTKRLERQGGSSGDVTAQMMDIQRKYGDHLYDKGKFDLAIEQYVEAIGYLEPSYVIRRFLDTQRIHNLTKYLEELHHEKHRLANKNHTTLLLNCYTKQRNEAKLNEFIARKDIVFDVANAIKVCREAGYYEAATFLAKTHNEPSAYVKIEMEHRGNFLQALNFIKGLPVNVAEEILKEHGKELLAKVPLETTETLIQLCSAWSGPPRETSAARPEDAGRTRTTVNFNLKDHKPPRRASAEDFIPTFVDSPLCLMHFLESVVKNSFDDYSGLDSAGQVVVYNTLLELYLTKDLKRTIRTKEALSATTVVGGGGQPASAPTSLSTLQAPSDEMRRQSALKILETHEDKYDKHHALVLCQQHDFREGTLFLLQQLKLYSEIFAFHAAEFEDRTLPKPRHDRAKMKLLQLCEESAAKQGEDDASREMLISYLTLLVRCPEDVSEDITAILRKIEAKDLLPPVAVIDILSSNPKLQLKTVREYLMRMLQRDCDRADKSQELIKERTDRSKKFKDEIQTLATQATVFQSNKCAACASLLDNPAIHFLCKHSYHQRCLNDPRECNICGPENRKILAMQKEYDDAADDHNGFFTMLRDSKDGFGAVAEYFGRSIFSNPKLRREALEGKGAADDFDAGDGDGGGGDWGDENGGAGGGFDDEEPRELDDPQEVEMW